VDVNPTSCHPALGNVRGGVVEAAGVSINAEASSTKQGILGAIVVDDRFVDSQCAPDGKGRSKAFWIRKAVWLQVPVVAGCCPSENPHRPGEIVIKKVAWVKVRPVGKPNRANDGSKIGAALRQVKPNPRQLGLNVAIWCARSRLGGAISKGE